MIETTLHEIIANRDLHTAPPTETIRKACIKMAAANIGALPVVGEDNRLLGIVSERDVIKRSIIVYRPSDETPVSKIMTPDPKWLPPSASPQEAVKIMVDGGFRHLPVCYAGCLLGIVSIRDFNVEQSNVVPAPIRHRSMWDAVREKKMQTTG